MKTWWKRSQRRRSGRMPGQSILERLEERVLLAAVINTFPQTSFLEDTTKVISGLSVASDSEPVTLTLEVPQGTLTVTAPLIGGLASGQISGSGTNTVILAGTVVDINQTLASGLSYVPPENLFGDVLLNITLNNLTDPPETASITLTVSPVEDSPTVTNQIANQTTTVGQAFSFEIPPNTFSDAEGDAITLSAVGVPTGLTFTPAVASANPTGTFSGTPTVVGTFNVTVTATATGGSVSDTFTITVGSVNEPPTVANDIDNQTATVGQVFSFSIPTDTFTDPEGDEITLSAIGVPPGLSFTAADPSATPTGNFSGTPTAAGTFDIIVTATAEGGSVSDTFTITVSANGAPTVSAIADQTATVGLPFSFAIPTTAFTDPDGDAITLSAIGVPAGLTFTAGPASANPTGNFSGTPTTAGTFFVTVSGTSTGGTVSHPFTIVVDPNGAPTVTAITNQPATVGQPFSFAIPTTPATFTDPDGDAITLSAIGVPAGLTFTAGPASANPTGNFSGTPTTAGTFFVTVTGTATGGSVSNTFAIMVSAANQPPTVANAIADRTLGINQAVSFTVPTNTFTDPEGDAIALSATGLPPGVTFSAGPPSATPTGTFGGAPTAIGTFNVTITATATGGSVSDTFTITVVAVNDAPTFTVGPDQTVAVNSDAQTVLFWATNISAGPSDEADQTVSFAISNDNPGLFSVQPAVAADGTLTYTPASGAIGKAEVSVQAVDDGGTDNGGINVSAVATFEIVLSSTPSVPKVSAPPGANFVDNANPVYQTPKKGTLRAFVTDGLLIVEINGVPQPVYLPSSVETLTIIGGSKNDEIDLTGLDDTLYTALALVVIKGGAGHDRIVGSFLEDSIDGGSGNDTLSGGDGDDTIQGGSGTDLLTETADVDFELSDTELTGLGTDRLLTIEKAVLTGGESDNVIDASEFTRGSVTLIGGAGDDELIGGTKNDVILGEDGDDILSGGDGKDTILGGFGEDELYGDGGNDLLIGGFDDDLIEGGAGRDTAVGGNGGSARGGEGVEDDGDDITAEVINEAYKKLFAFE